MKRIEVAKQLGEYYSRRHNNAKLWSFYDTSQRAYIIQGREMPATPEMCERYPNGWALSDCIQPSEARKFIIAEYAKEQRERIA